MTNPTEILRKIMRLRLCVVRCEHEKMWDHEYAAGMECDVVAARGREDKICCLNFLEKAGLTELNVEQTKTCGERYEATNLYY